MKMKNIFNLFFFIILIFGINLYSQIYNPEKDIKVKMKVVLVYEANLYGQKDFVIITGINLTDKKLYSLEIAPRWFLKEDFFLSVTPGRIINITGALSLERKRKILVRKLSYNSVTINLRTEKGFPLWRVPHKE